MPFTSDRRLFLDADGNVVEEGDPRAATLLVGAGGQLSDEEARRYGLGQGADPDAPTQAGSPKKAEPPANKARRPAEDK